MSYRGHCGTPGTGYKEMREMTIFDFYRYPPIEWIKHINEEGFVVNISILCDTVYMWY